MFIKEIYVEGIWNNSANIAWTGVDPKVNILVGNNGSGKSTLLNVLYHILKGGLLKVLKDIARSATIKTDQGNITFYGDKLDRSTNILPFDVCYVNTFDIPSAKKSAQSQLTLQLDALLYQRRKGMYSFTDYRLDISSGSSFAKQVHVDKFFGIINELFAITGKRIRIEQNEIVFEKNGKLLTIDQLSSGEKQMLILLFTVFLMKKRPAILLLDEPEISLHMAWQDKLLELLLTINPECQIFLTTHSPNIFADGWGDKLVFMEKIMKEV